jgi:hypothetical protein
LTTTLLAPDVVEMLRTFRVKRTGLSTAPEVGLALFSSTT